MTDDAEKRAKKLFTSLLRRRLGGVNFTIQEFGNSWVVIGGAHDSEMRMRKFDATFYKNNDHIFNLRLTAGKDSEVMQVSLDANVDKQAAWLTDWLLEK
jgi:hypothetical protein